MVVLEAIVLKMCPKGESRMSSPTRLTSKITFEIILTKQNKNYRS